MTLTACCWLLLGQVPTDTKTLTELGVPFERFTAEDTLGRSITAYVSLTPKVDTDKKRPVILVVSGSGCQSEWTRHEKAINSGLQGLVLELRLGGVFAVEVDP
jgi:hypothetical protein